MFKEIYNPTQKKCNVPENLGYDTKSFCSGHISTIVYRKESVSKEFFISNSNISLSKIFCEARNEICSITFFVFV